MSKVFVVSDPHFYHEKIAKIRGFENCEEYHEFYINEWNSTVSKRDVVYILGDITMEKNKYEILDKLNGIKHVILGNHDCHKRSHLESLMKHVHKIMSSEKVRFGDHKILLTHIPIHPIEFEYGISLNIHGHLHDLAINDRRYLNVCPEHFGYKPVLLNDIFEYFFFTLDGTPPELNKSNIEKTCKFVYSKVREIHGEMLKNHEKKY